ncbi:hypothetical protein Tco_1168459 [Tanacetum coccineum]
MPDSFGYSPDSDMDSKPTKDDSSNEDLTETAELHPDRPLMMRTLRMRIRTPVVLPSAIEATIADEIDEPPLKRARLSSPSSPPLSPLPSSSQATNDTSKETCEETTKETTNETITPIRLHKKSQARMWRFLISTIHAWRDWEGAPSTFEIGESSTTHVLLLTG